MEMLKKGSYRKFNRSGQSIIFPTMIIVMMMMMVLIIIPSIMDIEFGNNETIFNISTNNEALFGPANTTILGMLPIILIASIVILLITIFVTVFNVFSESNDDELGDYDNDYGEPEDDDDDEPEDEHVEEECDNTDINIHGNDVVNKKW